MNILLIGSGGRESAMAWKIAQSKITTELYITPGNAGSSLYGTQLSIQESNFEEIGRFCLDKKIGMVVIGPETPLALGIYDYFKSISELSNILIIGPSQQASQLESSKDFAKEFMLEYHIPTASYKTFTKENIHDGYSYIDSLNPPYVLKADGLAAGKGVVIVDSKEEAKNTLTDFLLYDKLGHSGNKVVIEEFLSGIECSMFVLTDGKDYLLLPNAKDYKRIGEQDSGLNTGGMGSISPVPFVDKSFEEKVISRIIVPTLEGIKKEKLTYCGFIFFGIIKVNDDPYVIEYNVRMGDPETESVMPRIESDIVAHMIAAATGQLRSEKMEISNDATATVMLVSKGYPETYAKGDIIEIDSEKTRHSMLFFAGVSKNDVEKNVTSGGRVIAVTSRAKTLKEALDMSYQSIQNITYSGMYYRRDIGYEFLENEL